MHLIVLCSSIVTVMVRATFSLQENMNNIRCLKTAGNQLIQDLKDIRKPAKE